MKPHPSSRCIRLLSLFLSVVCLTSFGVSFAEDPVSVSLTPIMDAALSEASPTQNYGTSNLVVGKSSSQAWESLLRFDLIGIPANAVIQTAELRMMSANFGSGGTLEVSQPTAGWAEASVNWQVKPAVQSLESLALTVTSPNDATLTFTATTIAYLQNIVSGVTEDRGLHLGFPLATVDQNLTLQSREGDIGPQLLITYIPGTATFDWTLALTRDDGRLRSAIFPTFEGAATPYEYLWSTNPGVRYMLWESTNLKDWSIVSGYPAVADRLTGVHEVAAGESMRFFKVEALDEQPPEIKSRFPDDGDFAIKRFYSGNEIEILIADVTGIDLATVSMTVGNTGTYTLNDEPLSYADGLLTFDLGSDTALGAYGTDVTCSLTMADRRRKFFSVKVD